MPTDTKKFSEFPLREEVLDTDRLVGLSPSQPVAGRNVRWSPLAWVNYVGKKLSALTATTLQWGGGWVDSQDQDGYTLLEALTPVGSGALGFYFYYDQTSTLQREPVYTNSYTGNPYTTRWQRFNGSASARRFDSGRDYAQDELVRFELNDRTDFYSARQELLRTNFPGGIVPAPTGEPDDENWLLESGAGQSYQPTDTYTFAGAYNASLAGTLPVWKRLRITNRQNPEGDVYAVFLEADTLIASQAWLVNALTTEGTYDLDTDTFTPNAGGGSGVTITQTPGQSTTAVMSQKAVTDALAGAGSGILYPATGQNTDGAMTQKATTDALATKAATSHTHTAANISDFATAADLRVAAGITAAKGAANGLAPLGSDSKIAAAYLPSYVDDVLEYAALANFPATGETGKLYVATGTNKQYRWSGSAYVELVASPGSTDAVPEGTVNKYYTDARADARITTATANNLTTTTAGKVLDARQGKVLADRLTLAETDITQVENDVLAVDNRVDATENDIELLQLASKFYGEFDPDRTYARNDYVLVNNTLWQSQQDDNTGNDPPSQVPPTPAWLPSLVGAGSGGEDPRKDLTTETGKRTNNLRREGKSHISNIVLAENASAVAAQVILAGGAAAADPRTGSPAAVEAALNADVDALSDYSFYTLRFISTPTNPAANSTVLVTVLPA